MGLFRKKKKSTESIINDSASVQSSSNDDIEYLCNLSIALCGVTMESLKSSPFSLHPIEVHMYFVFFSRILLPGYPKLDPLDLYIHYEDTWQDMDKRLWSINHEAIVRADEIFTKCSGMSSSPGELMQLCIIAFAHEIDHKEISTERLNAIYEAMTSAMGTVREYL